MRRSNKLKKNGFLAILVFWAICGLVEFPTLASAQNPGEHVVYGSANTPTLGSTAYIDASAFGNSGGGTGKTFCEIIYGILNSVSTSYPAAGAVVDARGLNSANANFNCAATANESPWYEAGGSPAYANVPSVILLPVGTISISYTWVVPPNTKLIGQDASGISSTQTGTVIQAVSPFSGPAPSYTAPAPLAMIQFGDPGGKTGTGQAACTTENNPGVCFHISLEDTTLNGNSVSVDGVLNMDAQELSYVRRVNFLNMAGTGLQIGYTCGTTMACSYYAQAQNSGPYEQIYYSGTAPCAQIFGAGTRGIHGINCVGTGAAGILLDSSSNSIEDVTVSGYTDGILVGSQSSTQSLAWGNALFNVGGSAGTNLIHVETVSGQSPPQDITILGATSTGGTATIQDDVTSTTLGQTTDPHVGMYVLGEPQATSGYGGYSRLTTSSSVPAWFVGTTQTISASCSATAQGSIYSATTGPANSGTLWACIGLTWINVK